MIVNAKNRKLFSLLLSLPIILVACDTQEIKLESSKKITVLGSRFVTTFGELEQFKQAFASFTEKTGIEVVYDDKYPEFENSLILRVDSGNAPDIAILPTPGLIKEFAREGKLVPIDSFIDKDKLTEAYAQDWIDLGSIDGKLYGIWLRVSIYSLVWYRPKDFAEADYEVPTTWDEMIALSDKIVADGGTPWCLGMVSGGDATGWVGTNWVEDIMLRTVEPEIYDQWVNHQIPFNHPVVKNAFEQFGKIALNPDYVVGGTEGVINTSFVDSPKPLFDDPPGCYMHRQADFIADFFPETVNLDKNVSVFSLPKINKNLGVPILVSGDVLVVFNDTPKVQNLIEYLATVNAHKIWASYGHISPHKQVSLDLYPNEISKRQAEILNNAEVIRLNGSDMMPGAWTGIVDYVSGTDVDTVLNKIEESWQEE